MSSPFLTSSQLAEAHGLLISEQDWTLCENNQAGVNSSAFTPGPYSTKREYNVIRYTEWYLHEIARP